MAKRNSSSPGLMCVLALSCWIRISLSILLDGHFSKIVRSTLVSKKNLLMSLPIKVIGFVSRVPAGLFTLLLLACSSVVNEKIPIFSENMSSPFESNLGHVIAAKNITYVKKIEFLQVRTKLHSSNKR